MAPGASPSFIALSTQSPVALMVKVDARVGVEGKAGVAERQISETFRGGHR